MKHWLAVLLLAFQAAPAASQPTAEMALLQVQVNQQNHGDQFVYVTAEGDVLLDHRTAEGLGLRLPPGSPDPVSLRALAPDLAYRLDPSSASLDVTAPQSMLPTRTWDLKAERQLDVLRVGRSSSFLNYSLNFEPAAGESSERFDVPLELGLWHKGFSLLSGFDFSHDDAGAQFERRLTTLTYDRPSLMQRIQAGDVYASNGPGGSATLMGGLSISSRFGMQYDFVSSPRQSFYGFLETPSEVDLYINGTLVRSESFGPGELNILNPPLSSGPGDVELVVKDAFGREVRIPANYYFASQLLKPGLSEYSYNLGFPRGTGGDGGDEYGGDPLFMAYHRHGFSDTFTAGVWGGANPDGAKLGLSTTGVLWKQLELRTTLGASKAKSRDAGYGGSLDLNYSPGRRLNWSARAAVRAYSEDYGDPFAEITDKQTRWSASLGLSKGFDAWGSVSLAYSDTERWDDTWSRTLNAYYTVRPWTKASLSVNGRHEWNERDETWSAGATLMVLLGQNLDLTVSAEVDEDGEPRFGLRLNRGAPAGPGYGYTLETRFQEGRHLSDSERFRYNTRYGDAAITRNGNADADDRYRLSFAGSVATVGTGEHFGRPISDGFAVVRVADLPGTEVMQSNQSVGKTDRNGEILVTRLPSYYPNQISVHAENLPMGYNLEQDRLSVMLPYRAGGLVEFGASRLVAVEGRAHYRQGHNTKPATYAGLGLLIDGGERQAVVGDDGVFYLENLKPGRYPARLFESRRECRFELIVPPDAQGIITDLGDVYCDLPVSQGELKP